jgi:hypothetical protein
MKEKKMLLTFDYELFLGKCSGTVERCLLEPTYKIQLILKKHQLQAIFFIDTTYIYRLVQLSKDHPLVALDLNKIISQLKLLAEDGHSLFHHFHPHWLDAIYDQNTNQWDCSNHSRFALSHLEIEEISTLIDFSTDFLKSMYQSTQVPEYFGFRAGGLYSQPFERLVPLFKEKKIKYDFSVLKGARSQQSNFGFDYTQANNISESNYRFEKSNTLLESEGYFVEYSMTNFTMPLLQRLINSMFYRLNAKKLTWTRFGDGNSSGNTIQRNRNEWSSKETFSIELLNKVKAFYYFYYLKKHSSIHLISHPKLLSIQSVDSFDLFLQLTTRHFRINSKFDTFL